MAASTAPVTYQDVTMPWWLPIVLLGLVTCALAYCVGIAASRRLGPRLASFISLFEVVSALGFAWLLLGELPKAIQLGGGLLVLVGVVTVRSGEPAPSPADVRADRGGTGRRQAKSAGLNAFGSTRTSQLPETSRITASTP
jgi:drug/metabolite transporter (DMT)-like permease